MTKARYEIRKVIAMALQLGSIDIEALEKEADALDCTMYEALAERVINAIDKYTAKLNTEPQRTHADFDRDPAEYLPMPEGCLRIRK